MVGDHVCVSMSWRLRGVAVAVVAVGLGACGSADQREPLGESTEALAIPVPYMDCPSPLLQAATLRVLYVSPTGNDTNDGLTVQTAVASLAGAQSKIEMPLSHDYSIRVLPGTYRGHATRWWKTSANHRIHIIPHETQPPVFDGTVGNETKTYRTRFFDLDPDPNGNPITNITISGLSIKNYVHHGIRLGTTKGVHNSCNRLLNNQVDNIGDAFGECHLVTVEGQVQNHINAASCVRLPNPTNNADIDAADISCEAQAGGTLCKGYGALDLVSSSKNVLSRNISRDLINHVGTRGLIHGIYVAHISQDNLIQENYIRNCRGAAIKFRDACDNNHVIGNYVESSVEGTSTDPSAYLTDSLQSGVYSKNIEVRDNLLTFGYMSKPQSIDLTGHSSSFVIDAAQSTGLFFQPNQPTEEDVTAMAVADIDGDGLSETFVALHYPDLGFTKVVYSDGRSQTLSRVAYTSTLFKVTSMAVGNFDGTGPVEVVSAFYSPSNDLTQVHRGVLADGTYSLVGGGKLLDSIGSAGWKVTAMTAGQFSGTVPKLYTAVSISGTQQIHRGDGITPQSGASKLGVSDGTIIYSSNNWAIPAISTGKIDSSGALKLITAFRWLGSGSPTNRIYLGDASVTNGATNGGTIFESSTWQVRGLATGKLDGSATRLISAFDAEGTGKLYLSNSSAQAQGTSLYSNSTWDIAAIAVGNTDSASAGDEVTTAFDQPSATQVHSGDGTTSGSGATNVGSYYRWPLADPLP